MMELLGLALIFVSFLCLFSLVYRMGWKAGYERGWKDQISEALRWVRRREQEERRREANVRTYWGVVPLDRENE